MRDFTGYTMRGISSYAEKESIHYPTKKFKLWPGYGPPKGVEMQDTALTIMPDERAMTIEDLKGQVNLIQHVMKEVMNEGEHYGVIPGTQKPTLLKPGAEKLCFTFFLDPDYEILKEVLQPDFVYYRIKCILLNQDTGRIRTGLGSCGSKEGKYRYRNIEDPTDKLVPKSYWKNRDKSLIGGKGFKPWKNPEDDKWYIAKFKKVENDNPLDLDNTILKMACKRALVAATLNATAASDIFTQDIEDMDKEALNGGKKAAKKTSKPKKQTPKAKTEDPPDPFDAESETDQGWSENLNATKKGKLFFVAGQEGVEETELEQLCIAYSNGKPFDNDMAGQLIDNFPDAVAAFKEGTL